MRKLKLDVETLEIDSFETAAAMEVPGTVPGNAITILGSCASCLWSRCRPQCTEEVECFNESDASVCLCLPYTQNYHPDCDYPSEHRTDCAACGTYGCTRTCYEPE